MAAVTAPDRTAAQHQSLLHFVGQSPWSDEKLRWRIERDYQELKQELGLGHFEGRGWRGFHHHATLCIAAYGFLVSERETIPLRTSCHRVVQGTCRFRSSPTQRRLQ